MTPDIVRVAPAPESEWQRFWEECATSTYFHSPEWARIWAAYGRGRVRPSAKLVCFSDGAEAVVPWSFETKARGLLSRYVASIHGTYGGWLSREPLAAGHAVRLVQWMTRQQGKSVVWRMNPFDAAALRAGALEGLRCRSDVTHAVRLPRNAEELLQGFKASYRSQIRKADSRGEFELSLATSVAEWREYFSVYQDSLARWGDAPATGYGWQLFEILARLQSPHVKLWVARQQGKMVSGDVCLYANRHVAYWHGATLKSHLKSSVAKLLKFRAMEDALLRGFEWYDLNPSAGLSGVTFFKEGFNATVLPAPLVYVDSPLKRVVRGLAGTLRLRHARLPLRPLGDVLECYNCAPPVAPWGWQGQGRTATVSTDVDERAVESGLAPVAARQRAERARGRRLNAAAETAAQPAAAQLHAAPSDATHIDATRGDAIQVQRARRVAR